MKNKIIYADGYEYLEKEDEIREKFSDLLAPYNEKAGQWMAERKGDYVTKYKAFQRTKIWKEARKIVIDYYKVIRGNDRCSCGREMNPPYMHHSHYYGRGWFDLKVVTLICRSCNANIHINEWK